MGRKRPANLSISQPIRKTAQFTAGQHINNGYLYNYHYAMPKTYMPKTYKINIESGRETLVIDEGVFCWSGFSIWISRVPLHPVFVHVHRLSVTSKYKIDDVIDAIKAYFKVQWDEPLRVYLHKMFP